MITEVHEDRLAVISDLHLGNPFCKAKRSVVEFLDYAAANGFSLCINGDGLDIVQTSFVKLAKEVPDVFHRARSFARNDLRLYYSVGNHDIVLEHFLEDWGAFRVVPFLNVTSGSKRIRVEHGHLYDPFFVKHPDLYELATRVASVFLDISPDLYRLWMKWVRLKSRLKKKKGEQGIVGEDPAFLEAVREIAQRGFDAVVFGHTHHPGVVELGEGKTYVNPGSWLGRHHYVEIDRGEIALKRWQA